MNEPMTKEQEDVKIIYRIIKSCKDCPKMKVIGNPVSCGGKAPFLCTEVGKRIKMTATLPEWCPLENIQKVLEKI